MIENQAVGHTTLAQYSNCTHDIVLNYLLNSQVGRELDFCVFRLLRPDGMDPSPVTSAVHQVRTEFERFLPRYSHQYSPVPMAQVKE